MSIDAGQLRDYVIVPALTEIDMCSDAAVNLVFGTAATESDMGRYLHQKGGGPALGIYQMEPATHDDIWRNYLCYKPKLAQKVREFHNDRYQSRDLIGNLWYATIMCRIHYYRSPMMLPDAQDLDSLAKMWKKVYNTELGKGKAEDFIEKYNKYVR